MTNFWRYELAAWLHALSLSLVWVFVPILILQSGYTVSDVILYYLLFNIIDVPLNFAARNFIQRYGARWAVAISTFAVILFFLIFLRIDGASWPILFALAACGAFYDAFYWVAHVYLFMNSDKAVKHTGRNTGIFYAVRQSALMVGPMVGAGLLIFFNQSWVLIATIFGLALSLVPLLGLQNFPDMPEAKPLNWRAFFSPGGKQPFVNAVLYAIHDSVESSLFPLFIFIMFGTLASVALVSVIVSLSAIVFALVSGYLKPRYRKLVMLIAALIVAVVWIGRLHDTHTVFLYISVLIVAVLAQLIQIPIDTDMFEHSRRMQDPLTGATYRNVAYMGINVLLYGTLFFLVHTFNVSFVIACVSLFILVGTHVMYAALKK